MNRSTLKKMSVTLLTQYVVYECVYVCLCECGCPHSCHASICVSVYLQELECVHVWVNPHTLVLE